MTPEELETKEAAAMTYKEWLVGTFLVAEYTFRGTPDGTDAFMEAEHRSMIERVIQGADTVIYRLASGEFPPEVTPNEPEVTPNDPAV